MSDFHCSTIQSLSARFSQQTEDTAANAVRWKPREKLSETNDVLPQYKSGIYSLGMTIIEALTGAPPFGMDAEENIMASPQVSKHHCWKEAIYSLPVQDRAINTQSNKFLPLSQCDRLKSTTISVCDELSS
ncbi:unnamed protein product [Phytophthora lilii]|uniref:Unnamed protein product n=1 Tax=Phytophthora lilii TaxID=2077276 RepID=A0A9W6TGL5_9STRA|nr:unnamed protein product [Phytophthora lilii]